MGLSKLQYFENNVCSPQPLVKEKIELLCGINLLCALNAVSKLKKHTFELGRRSWGTRVVKVGKYSVNLNLSNFKNSNIETYIFYL